MFLSAAGVIMQSELKQDAQAATSYNFTQTRGVWHRPNVSGKETTLKGICEVLDVFVQSGINVVYLETFYHGMSMFRSQWVPYYSSFDNYDYSTYPDYLSAFAAEAQKRGIEVHAWVQDFYVGVSESTTFVQNHKDWLMRNQNGSYRQTEGKESGGYIFLDPANSEVREFLLNYYDELLTKVPQVAGLNLDYIRYPVSDRGDDTGFTETAMQQFCKKHNLEQASSIDTFLTLLDDNNLHEQWTYFRAEIVTAFVRDIFKLVQEKHPNAVLSTAVFPDFDATYKSKKQDIATWLKSDYIDVVTPMVYYYEAAKVGDAVEKIMEYCKNCYCYTGIYATYHNQSQQELLAQIQAGNNAGADGFVLFDSAKTFFRNDDGKPDYGETLQQNFADKSALPHSMDTEEVNFVVEKVCSMLDDMQEDGTKVQLLQQQLRQIAKMPLSDMVRQLGLLVKYNLPQYLQQPEGVQQQLQTLYRSLEIKLRRKGDTPSTPPDDEKGDAPQNPDGGNNPDYTSPQPDNSGKKTALAIGMAFLVGAVVGCAATCFIKRGKK